MRDLTVTVLKHPDIMDILAPNERLLWSGKPSYGRRFFQAVRDERIIHVGLLVGAAITWCTLPFIDPDADLGRGVAVWVYAALTSIFAAGSYFLASQRQYTLNNSVYFITDKRAFICRRVRNTRFGERLYAISCPHSNTYPYQVILTRPYPSLRIGTISAEHQAQLFGIGFSSPGQPLLWRRINPPVTFDNVPDAEELLEMIQSRAPVIGDKIER